MEEEVEVLRPEWDAELCTGCRKCQEACHYNAIAVVQKARSEGTAETERKPSVLVFQELCHACGVCSFVCPEGALSEHPVTIGTVQADPDSGPFYFAHGVLNVGEPLAPAVVRGVKRHAAPDGLTIIDAAPGTACPVVEAVQDANAVLLVTEPTPFGLNDLRLALNLSLKLGIPAGIVVNRSDGEDTIIQDYADEAGVPVLGRIPFMRDYAEAYSRGELLVDGFPEVEEALLGIFQRAAALADSEPPPAPEEELLAEMTATAKGRPEGPQEGDYRECTIISGKGGTGKTTVTAALAALAEDKVLADCDVDAADLHLLLHPEVREVRDFYGGQRAVIDEDLCVGCGRCARLCHFSAIAPAPDGKGLAVQPYRVNEFACEGCGLCGYVCPVDAINLSRARTGQSYVSRTRRGTMSHARLGIAEENSGKLVTWVRERASVLAAEEEVSAILNDGSPGTGCPVIASISGVDYALIVTEPTVSGVHDLERVLRLCRHFGVESLVCINKCDLNAQQAERIRAMAGEHGATVVGEIPFDAAVNEALCAGKSLVEFGRGPAAEAVQEIWRVLKAEAFGH
jgi:MinD superfamily P-loop ATPase